jgi:hypothetical protein
MSIESLIEDSGQFATITAEAPDNEVPGIDPTGATDRSDANWVTVAIDVPCLVSPKSSAVRAYPGQNDARQAVVDARIYFLSDPVPTIGLSSRDRVTVSMATYGGPQVLGVYAVLGVINPNTMDRIFEVDCERLRTP